MLEIPNNILDFFFKEVTEKGKYKIEIKGKMAYIIPREEETYYKPIIIIPDIEELSNLLIQYIIAVNEFNKKNNIQLEEYQDLSYIFNIMLFNLSSSDANDLNKFILTRISFFYDNNLEQYNKRTKIFEYDNVSFYAERELESTGLETPFIMLFSMDINGKSYNLPLIRYAIDNDNTCYIYTVQRGRNRFCDINNPFYRKAVNPVNQGVKDNRNISPSFVLILAMFLKILSDNNISKIMIPDFLFNRYRKYYHANTITKSNEILSRMFHNISIIVKRMSAQIEGFSIEDYPLDIDSYFHISIVNLDSQNKMLKKLLKDNNN